MKIRHLTIALLLSTLLLASGCGNDDCNLPPLEEMNVLLIVIDTLRADDLGYMTPGLDISPNIDALAAGGVRFRHAIAPSPWTQPSISSLLTGLTPSHHGTLLIGDQLARVHTTLAERFEEREFDTAGIVSHTLVRENLGYAQGFDFWDQSSISREYEHSSEKVTGVAVDRLRRLQSKPFFMFVHYFDPHYQYLHHEEFDRTSGYDGQVRDWSMKISNLRSKRDEMTEEDLTYLHDLYREEIAFTDRQVGILLDELRSLGMEDDTLVILTADHGEEFGEHDWIGHTRYLYETLVHVPLVISMPGRLKARDVETPVSLLDIAPTLEALSKTPATDAKWDGRSLIDLLAGRGGDDERVIHSEVAFISPPRQRNSDEHEKEAFLTSATKGGWKLIHDLAEQNWELYSLSGDPGETRNLYADEHEAVRLLRPQLVEWERDKTDHWGREFPAANEMDDEERERLRSLGYIH